MSSQTSYTYPQAVDNSVATISNTVLAYTAQAADGVNTPAQYAVNDTIVQVPTIGTTGSAAVTQWFNSTKNTWLSVPPVLADLTKSDSSVDAEYSKVVYTSATGASTNINQVTLRDAQGNFTLSYIDSAGAVYTPASGGYIGDAVVRVVTGSDTGVTVAGTVTNTGTIPANSLAAEVFVHDGGVVYTADGTAPSASSKNGRLVNAGGTILLNTAAELSAFKVVAIDAGTPASLYTEYFNVADSQHRASTYTVVA